MQAASEIDLQLCYASPRARAVDLKAVRSIAASIEESGLLQPITVRRVQKSRAGQMCDAYEVIAGMHRVKAFRHLKRETIPAVILDVDELHAELLLIDENLCRNDLTAAERAAAQARRKAIYQELHPETKVGANQHTPKSLGKLCQGSEVAPRYDEAAAEATGQSSRTVRLDVHRGEVLGDDALAKVARTSLDKGEELDALAKLSEEARENLIGRAASGEKVSAKAELKKEMRATREQVLGGILHALPNKKYGVILADPEWRFEPWSRDSGLDRAADNHYPTSCTDVIAARDVPSIAADDCVLFLWATAPMLPHALVVMSAWGFNYVSNYVWAKDRIGTGYWNRNKHEHLLVGTRGKVPAPAMGTQWESLITAPVGEHSAKPECFLEMIEFYFPSLPKIELNRRGAPRPGWDAWGNEAEPMDADGNVFVHDPDTGEITETDSKMVAPAVVEPAPAATAPPTSQPAPGAGSPSPDGPPGASRAAQWADLEIPDFLRRKKLETQGDRL